MSTNFDPELHTFRSPKFESVVEDAINFFGSTPAHPLPPPKRFAGAGVYALYYSGEFELYKEIAEQNKEIARQPIYVGKAVPPGSRTGMNVQIGETADLFRRLREHTNSLAQAENLNVDNFRCRFIVLTGVERDLIAPVESALIRRYRPLWNANILSGFGIHTPGKGRFEQRRSRWDILHPGRSWAELMKNLAASQEEIVADVRRSIDESLLS